MRFPDAFIPFPHADTERSLPWRFQRQVTLYPTRPAVVFADRTVTYQELEAQSNQIARAILERVGAGSGPVGLLLGQGVILVAAILGILKSGRAYLPLSESWNEAVLSELMTSAGVELILVHGPAARLAGRLTKDRIPLLDPDLPIAPDPGPPVGDIGPDTFASIYYTSGSTGRPKGVVDTHRNVLHNILRYTNTLGISSSDRLTLLQGSTFSGAMSSLFGALLNGACVCPWDLARHTSEELADFLVRERLTIYHSVPTIFRAFLGDGRRFPDLRVIRLEGDQASHRDVELFKRHFDRPTILVNGLGATETGLVRQYFVDHDTTVPPGILPIGYPVLDVDVRLLDPPGEPVGVGQVGEIAVFSRYLAPGYWRRPDLTAGSFRPDPADRARRVYLTGDLGRLRPDGCLEYLGRRDSRVKIRGQSVEIADVESVLLGLPAVREAAVVAITTPAGEQQLVAYLVPENGRPPADRLRHALERVLPSHAIPARFVVLDALPLTDHRKVDRAALQAPTAARPELGARYAEAGNALESLLVHIWEELLDVHPVGTHDEFLALGGDSLLAVHMVERVERALGRKTSLAILLQARTVEELARALVADQPADLRGPLVRLNPDGSRAPFFFLHGDYWSDGLYCLHAARHLPPDQPFILLPPIGLDGGPVPGSIEEMAERHLEVLREIRPHGPYRLGGNCNGGLVAFEMARRLRRQGERIDLLVMVRSSGRTLHLRFHDLLARGIAASGLAQGGGDRLRWRRRLREFTAAWDRSTAAGRVALLWRKLSNVPRLMRNPVAVDGSENAPRPEAASDRWREHLRDVYMRAAREYIPGTYDGPVTLFWPERDVEQPEEAAAWWRKVAKVELQILPGDHLTYATVHVAEFANQLTARLT